jgi:hypothetical protein
MRLSLRESVRVYCSAVQCEDAAIERAPTTKNREMLSIWPVFNRLSAEDRDRILYVVDGLVRDARSKDLQGLPALRLNDSAQETEKAASQPTNTISRAS